MWASFSWVTTLLCSTLNDMTDRTFDLGQQPQSCFVTCCLHINYLQLCVSHSSILMTYFLYMISICGRNEVWFGYAKSLLGWACVLTADKIYHPKACKKTRFYSAWVEVFLLLWTTHVWSVRNFQNTEWSGNVSEMEHFCLSSYGLQHSAKINCYLMFISWWCLEPILRFPCAWCCINT